MPTLIRILRHTFRFPGLSTLSLAMAVVERFSEVFRNTALRCYQTWLLEEVAESSEDS
jgi:hypothetical protein